MSQMKKKKLELKKQVLVLEQMVKLQSYKFCSVYQMADDVINAYNDDPTYDATEFSQKGKKRDNSSWKMTRSTPKMGRVDSKRFKAKKKTLKTV